MPNPGEKRLNYLYNVQRKTLQQIADLYGVTRERVRQWMEKCGMHRRHSGTKSILNKSSVDICRKYIEGESVAKLAKEYKVDRTVLYKFLQRQDSNIKLKRKEFREKLYEKV